MSHSTNSLFNCPLLIYAPRFFAALMLLLPPSRLPARGVGHLFTAVDSPSPLFFDTPFRLWFPCSVGVGHILDAICSPGCPLESLWFGPPCVPTVLVGVGNNEDPVTAVRGTNCGSGYTVPFRIIPARGQVPENVSKEPARVA